MNSQTSKESSKDSTGKPLYLLCNDDGVHAPGIRTLAEALAPLGDVVIVAPHVERSASSHAITIAQPLRVERVTPNIYAVEGSPADCIMLACRRLLNRRPNWILSGINRGANLGIDTLYSGTVGAAMEGVLHGFRSMAISSLGRTKEPLRYETAAKVVVSLLKKEEALFEYADKGVLNINVPNLEFDQLKGIKTASLGRRLYDEDLVEGTDPRGRAYYWIGAGGDMFEDIPDSDCVLTNQGFVTLSVLRPSLFDVEVTSRLQTTLGKELKGVI